MKKTAFIFLSVFLLSVSTAAQNNPLIAGFSVNTNRPVGTLEHRFQPSVGFSLSVFDASSSGLQWGGIFDFSKFHDVSSSSYFITRKKQIGTEDRFYTVPLKQYSMKFEYYGVSANAQFPLLTTSLFDLKGDAGFGIYYWTSQRDAYYDSVKVDTGGTAPMFIEYVKTPALQQIDWSGGLNAGVEIQTSVLSPVIISASARYRIILAELWPTLALDLESVSGIQTLQFSVGLKFLIE